MPHQPQRMTDFVQASLLHDVIGHRQLSAFLLVDSEDPYGSSRQLHYTFAVVLAEYLSDTLFALRAPARHIGRIACPVADKIRHILLLHQPICEPALSCLHPGIEGFNQNSWKGLSHARHAAAHVDE